MTRLAPDQQNHSSRDRRAFVAATCSPLHKAGYDVKSFVSSRTTATQFGALSSAPRWAAAPALVPPPPPARNGNRIEMKKRKRIVPVKYGWEVARPKLLVWDLEGTLWEPEIQEIAMGTHVSCAAPGGEPFRLEPRSGDLLDRNGLRVGLIGDTRDTLLDVFEDEAWANVETAALSNSDYSFDFTKIFLKKFRVDVGTNIRLYQVFDHIILKRGSIKNHLEILRERSGIEYVDMLYFDNQRYNVAEAQELGVCALFVKQGFSEGTFIRALDTYKQYRRQLWRLEKPEDLFKNRKTGFKWAHWSGAGKWFIPSQSIMPRNRDEDWKKTAPNTANFADLDEKIQGGSVSYDDDEGDDGGYYAEDRYK